MNKRAGILLIVYPFSQPLFADLTDVSGLGSIGATAYGSASDPNNNSALPPVQTYLSGSPSFHNSGSVENIGIGIQGEVGYGKASTQASYSYDSVAGTIGGLGSTTETALSTAATAFGEDFIGRSPM